MVKHAIIVAGHAIVRNLERLDQDEGWYLLDFQRGEPTRYLGHIERAITETAGDETALLIFSGGPTRQVAGPISEALSYWQAADKLGWFGHAAVRERAYLEDFARDSFENLLFGICRFRELTSSYPELVTVVSWEFKRQRFEDLHRKAIGWPREKFCYIGANDPPHLEQALSSERSARAKYTADPYSQGAEFSAKKAARNPFRRQHGYSISCPELFTEDKAWAARSE